MAERTVLVKLDKRTVREVDAAVEQARGRGRRSLSRAGAINEIVARGVRDQRYLRAIGAA